MHIPVALERGTTDRWYGRCIGYPGTIAYAPSKQELLKELTQEINYHVTWLRNHHERVPPLNTIYLTIAEEVTAVCDLGESGGEVAFFSFDIQTITPEKMHTFFKLMHFSREDLVTMVRTIPHDALAYTPPGKSRTLLDIVHHICNCEEFYISRLGEEADKKYEEYAGMPLHEIDELPIFDRLNLVRHSCVKTLEVLIPQKKDAIFKRSEYTNHPREKWSAYKVLRRFLEHEREHYYNILEYLNRPVRTL